MEGWHGVRFVSPVEATRETIQIVRTIASGERLDHQGAVYQVPLPGGAGRPIRSMAAPAVIPIYLAALGPKNLALTGELADGWIGNAFMPETASAFLDHLRVGAGRAGRGLDDLDLVIPVSPRRSPTTRGTKRRVYTRRYVRSPSNAAMRIAGEGRTSPTRPSAGRGHADDVRRWQRLW